MIESEPAVSIVVPAYNEEESIGNVLADLLKIESDVPPMEIIVIDDGSTDRTSEEVKKFPSIRYIRHEKNMGKGAAIKTGFKAALGKVVVIQDADLEYPVTHIPHLVKPIWSGPAEVVFGSRFTGKYDGMSFSHYVGNYILSKVASLLYGANITDIMTGHKAFSSKVCESIDLKERGFIIEVELTSKILKAGWKIQEIPIEYCYRKHGVSKIRYRDGLKCLLKLLLYKIRS